MRRLRLSTEEAVLGLAGAGGLVRPTLVFYGMAKASLDDDSETDEEDE
jgi:hypothetical protein